MPHPHPITSPDIAGRCGPSFSASLVQASAQVSHNRADPRMEPDIGLVDGKAKPVGDRRLN